VAASLVDRVVELARIPAPTFAEHARLQWVESQLFGSPGSVRRDDAGNLVWSWGAGPPQVLVLAHVDTVFPEGTRLDFRRQGDLVVGPGIGDNAAAVVATLEAVSRLLGRRTPRAGAVAFTVGEEGLGNLHGALHACRTLTPEMAVAVEGQGIERVLVDAVGSLRARLRVQGPGGHSWVDRGTPSAIHALFELGSALAGRGTGEVPVNVGLVAGGRSVNSIADAAELTVEARSVEEADLVEFGRVLEALKVTPPLELGVEVVGRRGAGRLDRDHELLRVTREVRYGLGLPDELGQGSTDANAALALGIPALTLGVTRGGSMHSLEEWIDVGTLDRGVAQLELVLARLLDA
jgi:acetylornithine deacetylase/succinyl-diaminopimelate desuccinylase-like protein